MDVPCRKCGALVPADHAFCAECGATLAETMSMTRTSLAADSEEFAATMLGEYPSDQVEGANVPAHAPPKESKPSAARPVAAQVRERAVTSPEKAGSKRAGSKSGVYFILGLLAVLILGGLLFYLLSVILSR